MKRNKIVPIIIIILCATICAFGLFACGSANTTPEEKHVHNYQWVDNGDGTHKRHCSNSGCDAPDINIGEHRYDSNGICGCGSREQIQVQQYSITFNANGGRFANGQNTYLSQADQGALLTAPDSPVRNGYSFVGWADNSGEDFWDFANDKVQNSFTLYAVWDAEVATIISVDQADVDENSLIIDMFVTHDINGVNLSDKVICNTGSTWKLYYDMLGQNEIPTKIATGRTGSLIDGDNVFYIVVSSESGAITKTYTLTVYRSYSVTVSYYDNKNTLLRQEIAYTGVEYSVDNYTPDIAGYTFNGWKDVDSYPVVSVTPYDNFSVYADCTAVTFSATLDVNGGDTLSDDTYEVAYDADYRFDVPTRTGYSFIGWYCGGVKATNENGVSLKSWNYTSNETFTAEWQVNACRLILCSDDTAAGALIGAGEYDYGSTVTVSARPNSGYTFLGWYNENDLISSDANYSFIIEQNISIIAKWAAYTLTTDKNLYSAGDVTEYNRQKITAGQSVTITATTNGGYTFLGWYDGTRVLTKNSSYTFTMPNANIVYTAKWTTCPVTLEKNIAAAGNVSMPSETVEGQYVTITATTNSGYTWLGWYNGNTRMTTSLSYSFTLPTAPVVYTAKWAEYTLTTTVNKSSAGTLTTQYTNQRVTAGQQVTVTARTNVGYTFVGWYVGSTLKSRELSYSFSMPSESMVYTAKWSKVTIARNDSSAGSTTSLSGTYKYNDRVTVTATTNSGYTWLGWYNGNVKVTEALQLSFAMPADDTKYTAKWTYYTLTTDRNDTAAGTITNYSAQKVTAGQSTTLTATTSPGYTFIGWYNGTQELTKNLSYTFAMPSENVTYTAKWSKVTIACSDSSAGSTTSLSGTYKVGDSVTVTATTNNGYTFVGWYNGMQELTKDLSYTFVMPSESVTYTAKWTYYTLTTDRNDTSAGTITNYYSQKVTAGQSTTVTATTNLGYTFVGWYNGAQELTKDLNYTFVMPSENVIYTAKWTMNSEMNNFYFSSTPTVLSISGVKDKTISEIIVPEYVTNIDGGAFSGCSSLHNITVDNNNSYYSSQDGILYNKAKTEIVCIPKAITGAVVIPDGVTSIGDKSFYYCNSLTSIEIPNSVTSIGSYAFWNCNILASIIIGNSVTSIGSYAFNGCYNLSSIEIPKSVTSIGSYAFNGCSKLTSIDIPSGITSINDSSFEGCYGLMSIEIPDNVTIIGYRAFYGCSSLTSVVIGNRVKSISSNAFAACSRLTSIEIPRSVTSISDGVFANCSNLEKIIVDKDNTAFSSQDGILYNKIKTEFVYIPKAITGAVVIPDGVTSIGDRSFYYCSNLTSIDIPNSVTSIGKSVFAGCSSLNNIVIPNSVISIGDYAFYNCSELTNITFDNSEGWWYADSSTATSGTDISVFDLSDPATAATYLTTTYSSYYWKRS